MTRALASTNSLLVLAAVAVISLTFFACDQEPEEVVPATTTPVPTQTSTPLVDGLAPEGCTAEEGVYVDPDGRFAVCYLPEMKVTITENDPQSGTAVALQYGLGGSGGVSVQIGWIQEPTYVPCMESLDVIKNQRFIDFAVSGTMVQACTQDHHDTTDPEKYLSTTMDFAVPRKAGAPILVSAGYVKGKTTSDGQLADEATMRILGSLHVY